MTAAELNPQLRRLIDARLEAIDRILSHGQVSWSERRSIVGEVETQIYELLARHSPQPQEEDVLTILASLDPPESYLPEQADSGPAGIQPEPAWRQVPGQATRLVVRYIPVAAGIVALVIVNCVIVAIIAASEGVLPWIITLGTLAWLNYVGIRRFRAWSVTRHGPILNDLRQSLAAWLMPKSSAPAT